jgi:hypothetical protein
MNLRPLTLISLTAISLLVASCANVGSGELTKNLNTRIGTDGSPRMRPALPGEPFETKHPRSGRVPVTRYYLPVPYVEVVAYQTRVLNQERIQFAIHPVALPDVTKPLLFEEDHETFFVESKLRVVTSPEGFLERITYGREPKSAQAAAGLARAALSVVAPTPLPFKGDDGIPEFSRVVFRKSFPVAPLLHQSLVDDGNIENGCPPSPPDQGVCFSVGTRQFRLTANVPGLQPKGPEHLTYYPSPTNHQYNNLPYIRGFYHRPLLPVSVSISELTTTQDANASVPVVFDEGIGYAPRTDYTDRSDYSRPFIEIDKWGNPRLSQSAIISGQFSDFVNVLKAPTNDVSIYLTNKWSQPTRQLLNGDFSRLNFNDKERLEKAIVDDLNNVVIGDENFSRELVSKLVSDTNKEAINQLLRYQRNTKKPIQMANRLLLDSVFSKYITRDNDSFAWVESLKGPAKIRLSEPAVNLTEILYCPNPWEVDAYHFSTAIMADQSLDIRFSAGTAYDIRAHRKSEVMAVVDAILSIPNSVVGVAGNLFNVTVNHRNADPDLFKGEDDKGPGDRPKVRPQ